MEVFAPGVYDENAAPELRGAGGGKAFAPAGLRSFGTPAPKHADAGRRALGDISNKAGGALTGPGKLAAATPRRALGDITNAGAGATAFKAAKPAAPPACGSLPAACSARSAAFVTEEVLAQAAVWGAEGTELLAGPSGQEQAEQERRSEEAHAHARLARALVVDAPFAAQQPRCTAVRPCALAARRCAVRHSSPAQSHAWRHPLAAQPPFEDLFAALDGAPGASLVGAEASEGALAYDNDAPGA